MADDTNDDENLEVHIFFFAPFNGLAPVEMNVKSYWITFNCNQCSLQI